VAEELKARRMPSASPALAAPMAAQ